VEDSYK